MVVSLYIILHEDDWEFFTGMMTNKTQVMVFPHTSSDLAQAKWQVALYSEPFQHELVSYLFLLVNEKSCGLLFFALTFLHSGLPESEND